MLRLEKVADELFFFFNDTATTEIYTLSLHDALPISVPRRTGSRSGSTPRRGSSGRGPSPRSRARAPRRDRKSTRLNSSHANISYAVFCLKKKPQRSIRFKLAPNSSLLYSRHAHISAA